LPFFLDRCKGQQLNKSEENKLTKEINTRTENIDPIAHSVPSLMDTCKIDVHYSFLYSLSKPCTFLHHKDIVYLQLGAWKIRAINTMLSNNSIYDLQNASACEHIYFMDIETKELMQVHSYSLDDVNEYGVHH
jgi:hypothetical protein